MDKEKLICDSVQMFEASLSTAIRSIVQNAYDKGFEAGYEKANDEISNNNPSVYNIDGLEFYDMHLSDGALIAILDERMPYFEAVKYNIPTVEQLKELYARTRVERSELVFPNGIAIKIKDYDFFWCNSPIDDKSEVQGIKIKYDRFFYKIWGRCFVGEKQRVIVVKNK